MCKKTRYHLVHKLFNEILKYKKMQNESRSKLERDKTYELCCEIKGKGD